MQKTLLATGSDVASLPGTKIDEKNIISSTGALSLKNSKKNGNYRRRIYWS